MSAMFRKFFSKKSTFAILFFLLHLLGCHALTSEELQALDDFVNATMACKNIPGLTLSMVKDGQTVLAKGYGVSDMEKGTPVTENTLFDLASCSKSFTATLLAMILSEHEDVTWSTPCKDYIPDFTVANGDNYRDTQTTIYDLLSHRVCMSDDILYLMLGGFVKADRSDYVSHRQYLAELCPFRSKYAYLNTMFAVAGDIAEKLEEDTFENLIQTRIYDPLGMTSSGFLHLDWSNENFSESYIWMPDQYWHHYNKSTYVANHVGVAAGGLISNAVDMARYMNFVLSGGKNEEGEQLVDGVNLIETILPQTAKHSPFIQARPTYPVDESSFSYALGWDNNMYRGYLKVCHAGSYPAFGSRLNVYPEANVGVFLAVNGPYNGEDHEAMKRIEDFASDLLLGEEPWLNTTTACTFPEPWQPSSGSADADVDAPANEMTADVDAPANQMTRISLRENVNGKIQNTRTRPLEDYVGTYGHKALGNSTISHESGSENLRYRYGEYGIGELIPTAEDDVFVITMVGPMAWFLETYTGPVPLVAYFRSSDGDVIDELMVPYVPAIPMHIFKRGELMHDPPPPVGDCGSTVQNSKLLYALMATTLIVLL